MNLGVVRWKLRKVKWLVIHWELNPRHFWLEPPVLGHWATTAGRSPTTTILHKYCTGGTECLSHTSSSHSVCAIWTPLGVDQKIFSIRREPMLSGFAHSKCLEHLASEVSWVRLPATAGLFTFLYFHLITSKFLYFRYEARAFRMTQLCRKFLH